MGTGNDSGPMGFALDCNRMDSGSVIPTDVKTRGGRKAPSFFVCKILLPASRMNLP